RGACRQHGDRRPRIGKTQQQEKYRSASEGAREPDPAMEVVDRKRANQAPDEANGLRDECVDEGVADAEMKYASVDARQPDDQPEVAEETRAPDRPRRQRATEIFGAEQVGQRCSALARLDHGLNGWKWTRRALDGAFDHADDSIGLFIAALGC